MKIKISFFKISLIAATALTLFNCHDNGKENPSEVAPLAVDNAAPPCALSCSGERELDLNAHVLATGDGVRERTSFRLGVLRNTNDSINKLVDSIPCSELSILKGFANGIATACATASVITGLRMSFGFDLSANRIKLIYEPVKLCLTATTSISGASGAYTTGTFSIVGVYPTKYYYNQAEKKFKTIDNAATNTDTAAYMRNILITRAAGTPPTRFTRNAANDTLSDVKSVFFSFQEIQQLYEGNPSGRGYLKIWNSLRDYPFVSIAPATVKKHGLFIGVDALSLSGDKSIEVFSTPIFAGKYANLAHLCPPNCAAFVFKIKPSFIP